MAICVTKDPGSFILESSSSESIFDKSIIWHAGG